MRPLGQPLKARHRDDRIALALRVAHIAPHGITDLCAHLQLPVTSTADELHTVYTLMMCILAPERLQTRLRHTPGLPAAASSSALDGRPRPR